jgi:preprotein translocase subunit YajC
MFASPAYAATGAAASGGAAPGGFLAFFMQSGIGMMLVIFAIFWFLIFRPQQRRLKQHQAMLAAIKKNDVVVTGGGLVGKVTRVDEHEVEVELAPSVRVKAVRGTLSEVRPHGAKPAND